MHLYVAMWNEKVALSMNCKGDRLERWSARLTSNLEMIVGSSPERVLGGIRMQRPGQQRWLAHLRSQWARVWVRLRYLVFKKKKKWIWYWEFKKNKKWIWCWEFRCGAHRAVQSYGFKNTNPRNKEQYVWICICICTKNTHFPAVAIAKIRTHTARTYMGCGKGPGSSWSMKDALPQLRLVLSALRHCD